MKDSAFPSETMSGNQSGERAAVDICLIDDDEIMHFLFGALMKKHRPGVTVTSYSNPKKVLKLLDENSFHTSAIVLDINMPEVNGWQFLQELERRGITLPVYILSSSDSSLDIARAKDFKNAAGYFIKPLTASHIDQLFSEQKFEGA